MSTVSGIPSVTQQIWQRFFDRADANGDGGLAVDELQAVAGKNQTPDQVTAMMAKLDADGDGQVARSEMPSDPLSTQMLQPLLNAQEYAQASADERAADNKAVVDSIFARADVDGDGRLSAEEWDAEKNLRSIAHIDGEGATDYAFILRPGADDNDLGQDDFLVARRLDSFTPTPLKIEDMRQDMRERIEASIAAAQESRPGIPSPAERRAAWEQEVRQTPLTEALLARLSNQLSDFAATTGVDFSA